MNQPRGREDGYSAVVEMDKYRDIIESATQNDV